MQESLKIDLENEDVRKKLILGIVACLFAIFVTLINFVVGVPLVLNLAIVAVIFIVFTCIVFYVKEEKLEQEAIELAEREAAMDEIRPYLQQINDLLSVLNTDLSECENILAEKGPEFPPSVMNNLRTAERIRDGLDVRAKKLQEIIDAADVDKIEQARELGESPLTFANDVLNSLVTQPKIPDLPTEQWEHTVRTLLESVRSELGD